MTRRRTVSFLAYLALAALAAFRCSPSGEIAGTSSGGEGKTIAGLLVDSSGNAVASATVKLRSSIDWSDSIVDTATIALDTTNNAGAYSFGNIANGTYDIIGHTENPSLVSLLTSVAISDSDIALTADTMKQPAAIRGTAHLPLEHRIVVGLLGTPYISPVQSDSSFLIAGIAPGRYTLWAIAENAYSSNGRAIVYADSIAIAAGQDIVYDSIALRRIHEGSGPVVTGAGTSCGMWNEIDGNWWVMNDAQNGGTSTTTPARDEEVIDLSDRSGSGCAAHIAFTFGDSINWAPYVGVGTNLGRPRAGLVASADLRDADSLTFWMKGAGTAWRLRAQVLSRLVYTDDIRITINPIPATWTRYTIVFSTDRIGGLTADDYRNWDNVAAYATYVQFLAISDSSANSGELWIDDIQIWF